MTDTEIVSGRIVLVEATGEASPYERFTITLNPDGGRTLRTVTRSPGGDLLRDVNMLVGADWRPLEGMGRLFFKGVLAGTVLRRVAGGRMDSYAWRPGEAMDHQVFDAPAHMTLGFHPVSGDAWKMNGLETTHGDDQEILVHTVSNSWNGSSLGHGVALASRAAFVARERVQSPAGRFDCEHFVWKTRAGKRLHIWRSGPHRVLVKMSVEEGEKPGSAYWLSQLDHEAVGAAE